MKKFKRLLNRIFPKKFPKYWKEIEYSENIDDTLRYITNNFIKRLEDKIIEEPNSYLWSHNRWKHKK